MSRLAAKPIEFDNSITTEISENNIKIKGPKGELSVKIEDGIELKVEDGKIYVNRKNDTKKSFQGLIWSLINNAVVGVSKGFSQKMEIVGKGWRSAVKGKIINLQVGYSQPVDFKLPDGVTATQENPGSFTLHSHDKQLLGQTCANIQRIRPMEPYKMKGIKLEGQYVRHKVRKTAAAGV